MTPSPPSCRPAARDSSTSPTSPPKSTRNLPGWIVPTLRTRICAFLTTASAACSPAAMLLDSIRANAGSITATSPQGSGARHRAPVRPPHPLPSLRGETLDNRRHVAEKGLRSEGIGGALLPLSPPRHPPLPLP